MLTDSVPLTLRRTQALALTRKIKNDAMAVSTGLGINESLQVRG